VWLFIIYLFKKVELRFAESTPFSAAPSFGFSVRLRRAVSRIAPSVYGLTYLYQAKFLRLALNWICRPLPPISLPPPSI
jgi:hypothetical protein